MNITILIPTRNRFEYIKKLVAYYNYFNFDGKIFILDSSKKEIFLKTQSFLNNKKYTNIKHYRFMGRPFECIKFFLPKIKTKFVCFSGDDDYFIVSGLTKSIKILEQNSNINSLNGLSIVTKIKKSFFLNIEYLLYDNFFSTKKKPVLRLIKILKDYRVPLFSIFRFDIFKKVIHKIPGKSQRYLCPTRIIHDEILESLLFVTYNKIHRYKFPFLIRTFPQKKYAKSSVDNLFMSKKFNRNQEKSISFVFKVISDLLLHKDKKIFQKNYKNYLKQMKISKPKYLIYLNSFRMIFHVLYNKIFNKKYLEFKKNLDWIKNN